MLCQKCHKSLATMRYAEVIGGKVSELQLCADCMNRMQEEVTSGFELSGASGSRGKKRAAATAAETEARVPNRVCRVCGADLKDAIQSGRVGCGACYDALGDSLEPLLRGFHVGLRHRGKEPHVTDERKLKRTELHSLRALLRSTLKSENYEEAAKLRDQIRDLETLINEKSVVRAGASGENRSC